MQLSIPSFSYSVTVVSKVFAPLLNCFVFTTPHRSDNDFNNTNNNNSSTMSLFDKVKRAGKSVMDVGAKTMLKTDIALLDREVKARKQKFGIEIYDLMEQLELDTSLSMEQKEAKIRNAFDQARKDIAVIEAKKECKREEIAVLDAELAVSAMQQQGSNSNNNIPPASGSILSNAPPAASSYQPPGN